MAQSLHSGECASGQRPMTLKIERLSGKRRTRIRLSGAFRSEHLDQVKAEIERGGPRVALDLEEVDLVDVEGVCFLNACEADGISVLHHSPYIREWMSRERSRPKARARKRKKEEAPLEDEDGKHV
jgi:glutathione S-transferase